MERLTRGPHALSGTHGGGSSGSTEHDGGGCSREVLHGGADESTPPTQGGPLVKTSFNFGIFDSKKLFHVIIIIIKSFLV